MSVCGTHVGHSVEECLVEPSLLLLSVVVSAVAMASRRVWSGGLGGSMPFLRYRLPMEYTHSRNVQQSTFFRRHCGYTHMCPVSFHFSPVLMCVASVFNINMQFCVRAFLCGGQHTIRCLHDDRGKEDNYITVFLTMVRSTQVVEAS